MLKSTLNDSRLNPKATSLAIILLPPPTTFTSFSPPSFPFDYLGNKKSL